MAQLDFGRSIEALKAQIDTVSAEILAIEAEKGEITSNLQGYECEGYEHFKTVVLSRELARLDEVRRTKFEPDDVKAQAHIHGQQQECMRLIRSKQVLQNDLVVCERRLRKQYRERDELQHKLDRKVEKDGTRSNTD